MAGGGERLLHSAQQRAGQVRCRELLAERSAALDLHGVAACGEAIGAGWIARAGGRIQFHRCRCRELGCVWCGRVRGGVEGDSHGVGGIIGAGLIALVLVGTADYLALAQDAGFASNGYGAHSPAGFDLLSVALIEILVTAVFVLIVLGTTNAHGVPKGFGPIAAGFGLALVHMISIPVSNTSVNPARSLATAVFQGDWALGQVWAFLLFPAIGAVLAGLIWLAVGHKPMPLEESEADPLA